MISQMQCSRCKNSMRSYPHVALHQTAVSEAFLVYNTTHYNEMQGFVSLFEQAFIHIHFDNMK